MQENSNQKPTSKERLLHFFELNSISLQQFYEKTGIPNDYLAKVENIGSLVIEKLADFYPELRLAWLFTGNGNMLCSQQEAEVTPTTTKEITESLREPHNHLVPLITPKSEEISLAYLRDFIKRSKQHNEGLQNIE